MTLDQLITGTRRGDLSPAALRKVLAALPGPELRNLQRDARATLDRTGVDRAAIEAHVAQLINSLATGPDEHVQALLAERSRARTDDHRRQIDEQLRLRGHR
jgi:hypothetical protein